MGSRGSGRAALRDAVDARPGNQGAADREGVHPSESDGGGPRRERWTYEQLGAEVGMSGSQAHVILARMADSVDRADRRRAQAKRQLSESGS